jgi:hypothetical protein
MAARSDSTTITTQRGLLSSELLIRLAQQPESVSGTSPDDYHLPPARRLRDAINRSWTDLQGSWVTFRAELAKLPEGDRATTTTRERWLLPLFAELGYGRLQRSTEHSIDGRAYPISHAWGAVPIHLLGADIDLSHRTKGVAGAAVAAPAFRSGGAVGRSTATRMGTARSAACLTGRPDVPGTASIARREGPSRDVRTVREWPHPIQGQAHPAQAATDGGRPRALTSNHAGVAANAPDARPIKAAATLDLE